MVFCLNNGERLSVVFVWTKHECPAERVEKLMENCCPQFPISFSTLIHTLTTLRQATKVMTENACGTIINLI